MKAQWVLGGAALALVLLAILVGSGATSVDLTTTLAVQSIASYPLDLAVNAHTALGQVITTVGIAAVLALVVWRRLGGWAWIAPLLILATGGVELIFKFALNHGDGRPGDRPRRRG